VKILCLDISSVSTGYSVLNKGRLLKSLCGKIKTNKKDHFGERLLKFEEKLEWLLKKSKPDLIVVEDIFHRNTLTYKVLAMFHGIVFRMSWKMLHKDPLYIKTTQARSVLGVKTKEEVFRYIKARFNLDEFKYDEHNDITDSIAIGVAYYNGYQKKKEENKRDRKGTAKSKATRKIPRGKSK
jgi:Holliday junction resolvasome RuvABC endonuclease subunit